MSFLSNEIASPDENYPDERPGGFLGTDIASPQFDEGYGRRNGRPSRFRQIFENIPRKVRDAINAPIGDGDDDRGPAPVQLGEIVGTVVGAVDMVLNSPIGDGPDERKQGNIGRKIEGVGQAVAGVIDGVLNNPISEGRGEHGPGVLNNIGEVVLGAVSAVGQLGDRVVNGEISEGGDNDNGLPMISLPSGGEMWENFKGNVADIGEFTRRGLRTTGRIITAPIRWAKKASDTVNGVRDTVLDIGSGVLAVVQPEIGVPLSAVVAGKNAIKAALKREMSFRDAADQVAGHAVNVYQDRRNKREMAAQKREQQRQQAIQEEAMRAETARGWAEAQRNDLMAQIFAQQNTVNSARRRARRG